MTEFSAPSPLDDPHFKQADLALKRAARNAILAAREIGEEPVVNTDSKSELGAELKPDSLSDRPE